MQFVVHLLRHQHVFKWFQSFTACSVVFSFLPKDTPPHLMLSRHFFSPMCHMDNDALQNAPFKISISNHHLLKITLSHKKTGSVCFALFKLGILRLPFWFGMENCDIFCSSDSFKEVNICLFIEHFLSFYSDCCASVLVLEGVYWCVT